MARFEVLGRKTDRELIRTLAKRLTAEDSESERIRAAVSGVIAGGQTKKRGILDALRRSPLVGADLDVSRPQARDRKVDL